MTWEEAVTKTREDYERVLGTVIETEWLHGYTDGTDDTIDRHFDPPIKVRVLKASSEDDLRHDTGGWLDPYWDVEPLDPAEVPDLRHCWIFGTSYAYEKEKRA